MAPRTLLLLFAAACAGERAVPVADSASDSARAADSVRARLPGGATAPAIAHQLGAFADAGRALLLSDSLDAAGWISYVRPTEAAGRTLHRVLVVGPQGSDATALTTTALRESGRATNVVADSAAPIGAARVAVIPVNRGAHGMAALVRWVRSPDGSTLLVTEDPAAVEAEPVPNGFVYASERGPRILQADSVWDVAPSPDWTRLATARAIGVFGREPSDTLTDQRWRQLARAANVPVESARAHAFSLTGMSVGMGLARPLVVTLDSLPPGEQITRRAAMQTIDMLGGWRMRWTKDGRLAVGGPHRGSQDYSPSTTYTFVDARGRPGETVPAERAGLDSTAWRQGPTVDAGLPPDSGTTVVEGRDARGTFRLTSGGGWIRIARGGERPRVLAPGRLLAATAGGRFVAALAPVFPRREGEQPVRLVVYHLLP